MIGEKRVFVGRHNSRKSKRSSLTFVSLFYLYTTITCFERSGMSKVIVDSDQAMSERY